MKVYVREREIECGVENENRSEGEMENRIERKKEKRRKGKKEKGKNENGRRSNCSVRFDQLLVCMCVY